MKRSLIALCAGLILVFSGCSRTHVSMALNESRVAPVGSALFTEKNTHFGGGVNKVLVFAGSTNNEIKLSQAGQGWTATKWGSNYGQALQTELTYPATCPQEANYQGYKLRFDKVDSNGLVFTLLGVPSGVETSNQ